MISLQSDVWRLLRCNISRWQLAGYAIANIVGLSVVLIGVLFYCDSQHSAAGSDAFFSRDYVVLSKKVAALSFAPSAFSASDIDRLRQQPWVRKVGEFTASRFAVNGAVSLGGRGLSSYMFFESVPDEFFDVKPERWEFDPARRFVPIILNKDYLALYNYGFAMPQHLPQVSERMIGAVPVRLLLAGDGQQPEAFDAAIVGFSSRLNTIAVPQSFMDWANDRFAPGTSADPSRLIVEIDRMRSSDMERYLRDEGIEMAGDSSGVDSVSSFLAVVSSVVAANGLVISALALFILLLSIFLMLQKSRATLRDLMLLGYAPAEIARYYYLVVGAANAVIALASLAIALSARSLWADRLLQLGLGGAPLWTMLAVLAVYVVGVTLVDFAVVRTHLSRIWRA